MTLMHSQWDHLNGNLCSMPSSSMQDVAKRCCLLKQGPSKLARECIHWGENYLRVMVFNNFSNGETEFWKKGIMILISELVLGCRIEANCPLQGPGLR